MDKHEPPMTPEQLADQLDDAWDSWQESGTGPSPRPASHLGGPAAPLVATAIALSTLDDTPPPAPVFATRLRNELLGGKTTRRDVGRSTRTLGFLPAGGRAAMFRFVAAAAFALLATGQLSGHGPLSRLTMTAESPTVSAQTAASPFAATLVSCVTRPTPSGTSEALPARAASVGYGRATQTAAAADGPSVADCRGADE